MSTKKILFVDDEPDFVHNMKTFFEIYGYECFEAHNGQEGLKKVEEEKPDLIVLDILMPNMDGYTMLREMKKRKIDVYCIIMTAKEKLKDLFELEKVDRFLTKPFDLEKLKSIVEDLLGSKPSDASKEAAEDRTVSVLVVDDEIKLVESVKRFLEMKGYTVYTALTGKEGLELFNKELPTIVLTDILMPSMDGFSMVKEIRKDYQNLPIIVMTGKDKMKDLIELEGINAFLTKPFDLGDLEDEIQKILSEKK